MNLNSTNSREIRKFGLVTLLLFGSLFAIGLWRKKPVPTYLFGSLATLGIGFILIPGTLRPVHSAWLRIAHFLGTLITKFIFALAYYLVITPIALTKRLFGGPPLPVKPDKETVSYWVSRKQPSQPKEQFLKRF